MKKSSKIMSAFLFIVITSLLLFTSCKTTAVIAQPDSIIGTWQDAYGLTEYKFEQDGKMKIQALDIGSFNGNYDIKEDKITIEYSVVIDKEIEIYTYELKDNKLYLDGKEFKRLK